MFKKLFLSVIFVVFLLYLFFDVFAQAVPEIKFFKDSTYNFELDYNPLIGDTIYVQVTGIKGGHPGGSNDAVKTIVYNSDSSIEHSNINGNSDF